ncbi:ead/Ea22-like family protein [Escherichia coli]|nr:ead/Ea22-like family protein [Escherichia coli]
MSEINYQALREAAEKATWGDWDSYKPHRGARGYEVRLSSQAIAQHVLKNNAEFIAAFNPKVALALLDEREKNQQYIKLRDQENEDIALTVGKLRVELEEAKSKLKRKLVECNRYNYCADAVKGVEYACHAAMLQGSQPVSNHEELPLDYLQGQKDGLEWAAQLAEANHPQTGDWLYDDPLELAKAIRKGPDMPEFDGPTPVTPDGWISCSERMPEETGDIIVVSDGIVMSGISYSRRDGFYIAALEYDDDEPIGGVTHWMPLPEPPQEVK